MARSLSIASPSSNDVVPLGAGPEPISGYANLWMAGLTCNKFDEALLHRNTRLKVLEAERIASSHGREVKKAIFWIRPAF